MQSQNLLIAAVILAAYGCGQQAPEQKAADPVAAAPVAVAPTVAPATPEPVTKPVTESPSAQAVAPVTTPAPAVAAPPAPVEKAAPAPAKKEATAAAPKAEKAAPVAVKPVAAPVVSPKVEKIDTSKLNVIDRKIGDGPLATAGKKVAVHYSGWLYDEAKSDHKGTKFDSSVTRGEMFEFGLGAKQVITGWEKGVEGMKVGGQRTLIIPPAMAYGESGAGALVPPNSVLVFDVELLGVR